MINIVRGDLKEAMMAKAPTRAEGEREKRDAFNFAEQLVNAYWRDEMRSVEHPPSDLPLGDVHAHLRIIRFNKIVSEHLGVGMLCARHADDTEGVVDMRSALLSPTPMDASVGLNWMYGAESIDDLMELDELFFAGPYRYMRRGFERFAKRKLGERFIFRSPSEVPNSLIPSLARFLATRIAFFRSKPPAQAISGTAIHLSVDVETQNPSVHVHAAPAYSISWIFFGGPTRTQNPHSVSGGLIPGRYIFGGRSVSIPTFIQDSQVFDIPPTFHCPLLAI